MSDLRELIKEEYRKKEKAIVNPQSLMEMVEEMMNTLAFVNEEAAVPKVRTYNISEIPLIPISEIGWANADEGGKPGDPVTQRAELENWLTNIQGATIQAKLENITKRMKDGFGEIPKDNPTQYIQEVISYLVFVKTLTIAITNFNASAAGFNFEAFLATLMHGQQIPASRSGTNSIADFTADMGGETVPVSLKLYTVGRLKVGGSYTDLSNDIMYPRAEWASWASGPGFGGGAMKYVACTKTLEGKGVEQEGWIDFYQFDFTRSNYFRLLGESGTKSQKCIASEQNFMDALGEWDRSRTGEAPDITSALPAKSNKGESSALAQEFGKYLDKYFIPGAASEGVEASLAQQIRNEVVAIYLDQLNNTDIVDKLQTNPLTARLAQMLNGDKKAAQKLRGKSGPHPEANTIYDVFYKKFKPEVIKRADVRGKAIADMNWVYDMPMLIEWYENLSDEAKIIAIKNSRGYIAGGTEFIVPNGIAIRYGGGTPFARLPIGAKYVTDMLNSARSEIMDEVFAIFNQMKVMSDKINSFFAHGLKEPTEAEAGAEAGEEAAEKARRVAGI